MTDGVTISSEEGRRLRLDPVRARRLATRFGARVLRDLLRGAGRPRRAIHRRTGGRYVLLGSRLGARRFWIFSQPLPDGALGVRAVRELDPEPDYSEGDYHREFLSQLVNQMGFRFGTGRLGQGDDRDGTKMGLRDGLTQVKVGERIPGSGNNPDKSYISARGKRINIEVDTDEKNAIFHLRRLGKRDPDSVNYGYVLGPKGAVERTYVRRGNGPIRVVKGMATLPVPKMPQGTKANWQPWKTDQLGLMPRDADGKARPHVFRWGRVPTSTARVTEGKMRKMSDGSPRQYALDQRRQRSGRASQVVPRGGKKQGELEFELGFDEGLET